MSPLPLLAGLLALSVPASAGFCSLSVEDNVRRIVSCRRQASLAKCREVAQAHGCSVLRELPSINAVVIKMSKRQAAIEEAKMRNEAEIDRVDDDTRKAWIMSSSLAMPGLRFQKTEAPAAEKPELAEQPWGVRRLRAAAAWPRLEGDGVDVAVLDTGIDPTHPDLAGQVAGGFNAQNPSLPYIDDEGHGTHVAGTIAAKRDGQGVVGVAPKARLWSVKVLDAQGNGSYSDIIAGIEWAAKKGIKVINMSLGAAEGSEALRRAVVAAEEAGVVIVAAAGNEVGGPVTYPGAYPETIAVGASNEKDGWAEFSSQGPEVDLVAPGDNIRSALKGGGYGENSGTSMACPHVAGLAALALEAGARGRAQVQAKLQSVAAPLPGLTAEQQGSGMPDAGKLAPAPVFAAAAR
jgi:subtilisin family serine protease